MKSLTFMNKKHILVISMVIVILIGILIIFATQKDEHVIDDKDVCINFESFINAIDAIQSQHGTIDIDKYVFVEIFNSVVADCFQLNVENDTIISQHKDPWNTSYILIVSNPLNTNGEIDIVSAGPDTIYFTGDDQSIRIICNIDNTITNINPFASEHEHKFEQLNWGSALIQDATCMSKPLFYESCRHCKLKNNMSFEFGTVNENIHGNIEKVYFYQDERMHLIKSQCSECHAVVHEVTEMHNKNLSCCSNQ